MFCGDRDKTVHCIWSKCKKLAQNTKYKTWYDWLGKGDLKGIVQEIKIRLYYQMVYQQTKLHLWKWNLQYSPEFKIQTELPIPSQRTRSDKEHKKKNLPFCGVYCSRRLSTESKSKRKKLTNTSILTVSWKSYGSWRCRWFKISLVLKQ